MAGASTIRTLVGEIMLEATGPADFVDPALEPAVGRVRKLVGRHEFEPGLIPRAMMLRAEDGAPFSPLRTFAGRLAHECGLAASKKSGRALGWQGENQYNMIVKAQTMHEVVGIGSENVAFEYVDGGVKRRYTSDLELIRPNGTRRLVEMKRTEEDLSNPDTCRKLAIVAELSRCCGIGFDILLAKDVFKKKIHRAQASEFASRAFVPFDDVHLLALKRHADETGGASTFGRLASILAPDRRHGESLVQAMTVARLVEIDLVKRLRHDTPLVLHPQNIRP